MLHFYTPENIRKLKVYVFRGCRSGTLVENRLSLSGNVFLLKAFLWFCSAIGNSEIIKAIIDFEKLG